MKSMKGKISKLVFAIIIAAIAIIMLAFNNNVEANTGYATWTKIGYTYNGTQMYRYNTTMGHLNLFCLKGGARLNAVGGVAVSEYDMYSIGSNSDIINRIFISGQTGYNQALWLIDNIYVNQDQSDSEKIAMKSRLKAIIISYGEDPTIVDRMGDDLIYTVEQGVLWKLTNSGDEFSYLNESTIKPGSSDAYKLYNILGTEISNHTTYTSKNQAGMTSYLNSLYIDSSSVTVNTTNNTVGPFVLKNYDSSLYNITAYTVKVNGSTVSSATVNRDGNNLTVTLPSSYLANSSSVNISIDVNGTAIATKATLLYNGDTTKNWQPLVAIEKSIISKTVSGSVTQSPIFDLHLSKNITDVYTNNGTSYVHKSTVESEIANRSIVRKGLLKTGSLTDSYTTTKAPVYVSTGDIVKYAITVHNEGGYDGYATQITDYIASGLTVIDPTDAEYNLDTVNYGWATSSTTITGVTAVSTSYLANTKINAYVASSNTLDSETIYIYCKVTGTKTGKLLKNIAEITADKAVDSNGTEVSVDDRDSTPDTVKSTLNVTTLAAWKGDGVYSPENMSYSSRYDVKGLQDDDDYENVKISNFDLALTKEIEKVRYSVDNGTDDTTLSTDFTRVTGIRLNTLNKTSTSAVYKVDKTPVQVKKDAIVTYKITVYNEGSISGYAEEISDYLPAGLELVSYTEGDGSINDTYGWTVDSSFSETGVTKVTSDYLNKANSSENVITAYDGSTLNSKYVEIECKVTSETAGEILTNAAEITKYGYYEGTTFIEANEEDKDVDSIEDTVEANLNTKGYTTGNIIDKYKTRILAVKTTIETNPAWSALYSDPFNGVSKAIYSMEDDDDFEQLEVQTKVFDLALRKSITEINGETTTDGYAHENPYDLQSMSEKITRLTKVDTSTSSAIMRTGTGEYYHGKEAITVSVGDEIAYTFRVYNEGTYGDYSGYAKEITDYLPEGLQFVGLQTGTTNYSAVTTPLSDGTTKVVITYNGTTAIDQQVYLLRMLARKAANQDISDCYQEVTIICKVTDSGNGKILTDRAEITVDQAVDTEGTNVDVDDRDSTPGSLSVTELNLDNYYTDYAYGVNDIYVDNYPGIEGDGSDVSKAQDDTDFENIKVKATYKLQIEKVDASNSTKKLSGVTFSVNATTNGITSAKSVGPTGTDGLATLTDSIVIDESKISTKDSFEITEVDLGNNEYITLGQSIKLYVTKSSDYLYDSEENITGNIRTGVIGISFTENGTAATTATTTATLSNGSSVTVTATYADNTIKITIPNRKIVFDLALRKFITGVNDTAVTSRIPVFEITDDGKYVYNHTKDPVEVVHNDVVTYTLRVYNEGNVAGYATTVMDDVPEGLQVVDFTDGDGSINDIYGWKMYTQVAEGTANAITYDGKLYVETNNNEEANLIVTNYLSKANETTAGGNLIAPFIQATMTSPDYKELKIQFKVTYASKNAEESARVLINYAQITDDSDSEGNPVDDTDSTPNEWIDTDDDQDIEKVKVKYFDLALKKWVSKAIVIEKGKETVTQTGHTGDENPEPVVKVDLKKSKINDVVVKFEYQIKVTNEGEIAGEVREISDYIPDGLKFVAADNPDWEEANGKVTTDQLTGTVLQPGESATVSITLTWINSTDNMGVKINVAEISEDYNDSDTPDSDSTPNNEVPGEDDIDDAPVMLTIQTGQTQLYVALVVTTIGLLATGIVLIKKFVL